MPLEVWGSTALLDVWLEARAEELGGSEDVVSRDVLVDS